MKKIIVISGQAKSGKSAQLKKAILAIKNKNTIIIDMRLEYSEFDAIPWNKAAEFLSKNEENIAILTPYKEDGKLMTYDDEIKYVYKLITEAKSGVLVLENAGMYTNRKIFDEICYQDPNEEVTTTIIYVVHSVTNVTTNVVNKAEKVILHQHNDFINLQNIKHRINNFEVLKSAFDILKTGTELNKYFYCTIKNWETIESCNTPYLLVK